MAEGTSALLQFLVQDAKIPPLISIEKMKDMQKAGLVRWLKSPDEIAKSTLEEVQTIFQDPKQAKQVLNAAKRRTKKRASTGDDLSSPSKKRQKQKQGELSDQQSSSLEIEESLALPTTEASEQDLEKIVLFTNRAPLVLAFAVSLLKFTMPNQPLSSRLSLAQAVVSANSKSKAISLGIDTGKTAEDEGWGEGQPVATVMGREIRVMKRPDYKWKAPPGGSSTDKTEDVVITEPENDAEQALWGLDLEAWKKSSRTGGHMPIHTAQSARSYLLRSFDTAPSPKGDAEPKKKRSGARVMAEKEHNLGSLLSALDLLHQSWASHLEPEELDRRAWGWYVRVRPDVESGPAGWGGKGEVKIAEILALRRGF